MPLALAAPKGATMNATQARAATRSVAASRNSQHRAEVTAAILAATSDEKYSATVAMEIVSSVDRTALVADGFIVSAPDVNQVVTISWPEP